MESKSANPPYIPVLIRADSDSKQSLEYPITIEGIVVTDDECKTSANIQPNILINRSLVYDNTHSKCLCISIEYVNFSLLISSNYMKRLPEHNFYVVISLYFRFI